MATIGAFEAKTHFSRLLLRVKKGEVITITKQGEPVAKLVPIDEELQQVGSRHAAVKAIRELRKGVTLGKKLTVKQLIKEGRKW